MCVSIPDRKRTNILKGFSNTVSYFSRKCFIFRRSARCCIRNHAIRFWNITEQLRCKAPAASTKTVKYFITAYHAQVISVTLLVYSQMICSEIIKQIVLNDAFSFYLKPVYRILINFAYFSYKSCFLSFLCKFSAKISHQFVVFSTFLNIQELNLSTQFLQSLF